MVEHRQRGRHRVDVPGARDHQGLEPRRGNRDANGRRRHSRSRRPASGDGQVDRARAGRVERELNRASAERTRRGRRRRRRPGEGRAGIRLAGGQRDGTSRLDLPASVELVLRRSGQGVVGRGRRRTAAHDVDVCVGRTRLGTARHLDGHRIAAGDRIRVRGRRGPRAETAERIVSPVPRVRVRAPAGRGRGARERSARGALRRTGQGHREVTRRGRRGRRRRRRRRRAGDRDVRRRARLGRNVRDAHDGRIRTGARVRMRVRCGSGRQRRGERVVSEVPPVDRRGKPAARGESDGRSDVGAGRIRVQRQEDLVDDRDLLRDDDRRLAGSRDRIVVAEVDVVRPGRSGRAAPAIRSVGRQEARRELPGERRGRRRGVRDRPVDRREGRCRCDLHRVGQGEAGVLHDRIGRRGEGRHEVDLGEVAGDVRRHVAAPIGDAHPEPGRRGRDGDDLVRGRDVPADQRTGGGRERPEERRVREVALGSAGVRRASPQDAKVERVDAPIEPDDVGGRRENRHGRGNEGRRRPTVRVVAARADPIVRAGRGDRAADAAVTVRAAPRVAGDGSARIARKVGGIEVRQARAR